MIGQRHIANVLAEATAAAAATKNTRKAGRLRCELVTSDLGEVLDLSRTGMRVRLLRSVVISQGELVRVVIAAPGTRLEVGAKVVWLKKRGLFTAGEAGLEFVALSDDATHAFAALVRMIMA